MNFKLSKMPPLSGTTEQKLRQIRDCQNKTVDELTRALEAQQREMERLRKEIGRSGKNK